MKMKTKILSARESTLTIPTIIRGLAKQYQSQQELSLEILFLTDFEIEHERSVQ